MSIITRPFAWLLLTLFEFVGNYGFAIILFSLVVKLILLPFQMRSKQSMMRMNRLGYKQKELEKKHEGNQQAYSQALQKMYKEEKVNPMSGCLWNLIPFPIMIALYTVIRQPMTSLMRLTADQITLITEKLVSMGLYTIPEKADMYAEIPLTNLIHENFETIKGIVPEVVDIDLNFIGINLGDRPQSAFSAFSSIDWSSPASWWPVIALILIPIVSAGISYLSMTASNKMNPQVNSGNQQQQKTMKYTMLMMPLVSLWICFSFPAALGIYWIAQGAFGFIQEIILNRYYKKKLDAEQALRDAADKEREAENELKRIETEKLRLEGKTTKNENTSKKKMQAQEKAKEDERRAAAERAEREERRRRLGIETPDQPDSQVGHRRYARGRAYVEDRFINPEGAEEATLAAAAESEFGEAIDETLEAAEREFDAVNAELEQAEHESEELEGAEESDFEDDAQEYAESGENSEDEGDVAEEEEN